MAGVRLHRSATWRSPWSPPSMAATPETGASRAPGGRVVAAALRGLRLRRRSRPAPDAPRSGRRTSPRALRGAAAGVPAHPGATWLALAALCFLRRPGRRPRHRGQRDVPAAHRCRRRDACSCCSARSLVPNAVALLRVLPARARLRGRHRTPWSRRRSSSLGPLPMFPLLAALPDDGPTPAWTSCRGGPAGAGGCVRRRPGPAPPPTLRWDEGALRGCAGGVAAGVLLRAPRRRSPAAPSGPGRMRDIGPAAFDVLVHAITAFGVGGARRRAGMTWWQRRAARRSAETA